MDESRFRTANVHHIYTRIVDEQVNGHICLCGVVMLTHRACTEHIVDAYRDDLRAKLETLPAAIYGEPRFILRSDVLALFDGDES